MLISMNLFEFYKQGIRKPKTRWIFVIGTLLYIISPVDIIPDFIPILGQIDDLALLVVFATEIARIITERNKSKKVIDAEFKSKY